MSDLHELLPWYVNETLEASEAAAFERHLESCADCRDELALLRRMQARLEEHGDAALTDHPSPQRLVDALASGAGEAGLTADESAQVRRHVAVCLTCADEARFAGAAAREIQAARAESAGAAARPSVAAGPANIAESGVAATGEAARSEPPGRVAPVGRAGVSEPSAASLRRRVLPWGWAVAAVLALVIARSAFVGPGDDTARTGIAALHTVEATVRTDGGPTSIRVPRRAGSVHLVLPVDAAPETFPLRLEILDAGGGAVLRVPHVASGDLSSGSFLFVTLRRADCPDGTYVARLSAADGRGTATEYPFRLIAE